MGQRRGLGDSRDGRAHRGGLIFPRRVALTLLGSRPPRLAGIGSIGWLYKKGCHEKTSSLTGHEQDVFGNLTGPGKAQKTAILLDKQGVLGKGCQH